MIFDAMKVTYNKYSCDISGMSRKMRKMDGRGRAECQNWEKRDIIGTGRRLIIEAALEESRVGALVL